MLNPPREPQIRSPDTLKCFSKETLKLVRAGLSSELRPQSPNVKNRGERQKRRRIEEKRPKRLWDVSAICHLKRDGLLTQSAYDPVPK